MNKLPTFEERLIKRNDLIFNAWKSGRTLQGVADDFKLSCERIRQITAKAKIRILMKDHGYSREEAWEYWKYKPKRLFPE